MGIRERGRTWETTYVHTLGDRLLFPNLFRELPESNPSCEPEKPVHLDLQEQIARCTFLPLMSQKRAQFMTLIGRSEGREGLTISGLPSS